MKIGLNTACLQKKSLLKPTEILDFTLKNGFTGIEFRDEYPFSESLSIKERVLIRNRVEREKLLCSVHLSFYDLNIGSFRKIIRETAVKSHQTAVNKAADLGASYVTVHGGKMSRSFYTDEWIQKTDDYSSESIYLIRETCKDAGIILCVENMSLFDSREYKSYTHPEDLIRLYYEHEKQIKVTFDFGHAVSIDPKPEIFVEKLGSEKISFGHLSDNNFIKDQHKAVGAGSIDYISFMQVYYEKKWNFPLFIETQTVEQTLTSKKYLEEITYSIAVH